MKRKMLPTKGWAMPSPVGQLYSIASAGWKNVSGMEPVMIVPLWRWEKLQAKNAELRAQLKEAK